MKVTEQVTVGFTADERKAFERRAEIEQRSLSAMIRLAALRGLGAAGNPNEQNCLGCLEGSGRHAIDCPRAA